MGLAFAYVTFRLPSSGVTMHTKPELHALTSAPGPSSPRPARHTCSARGGPTLVQEQSTLGAVQSPACLWAGPLSPRSQPCAHLPLLLHGCWLASHQHQPLSPRSGHRKGGCSESPPYGLKELKAPTGHSHTPQGMLKTAPVSCPQFMPPRPSAALRSIQVPPGDGQWPRQRYDL